jgi:hypothetical protein
MKLIFIVKILHLTLLWKRDHRQFGNGLLMNLYSKKKTLKQDIELTFEWVGSGFSTRLPGMIALTTLFRVAGNT